MKRLIYCLLLLANGVFADTIDHYMNIANNIPQMEMKADPQAQAWARSARNVLILTSESVVESLLLANDTARSHGNSIFCLPAGTQLNATTVNDLIQQTYRELSSQQSDKDKMTVSQVALLGITKRYPCQQQNPTQPGLAPANALQQSSAQNPSMKDMMHVGN